MLHRRLEYNYQLKGLVHVKATVPLHVCCMQTELRPKPCFGQGVGRITFSCLFQSELISHSVINRDVQKQHHLLAQEYLLLLPPVCQQGAFLLLSI